MGDEEIPIQNLFGLMFNLLFKGKIGRVLFSWHEKKEQAMLPLISIQVNRIGSTHLMPYSQTYCKKRISMNRRSIMR